MGGSTYAEITPIKGRVELASTDHHTPLFQDENEIVRHATLSDFRKHPDFAKSKQQEELYLRKPGSETAWAMGVDMNACIGCNACVIACQAENNVPTVGKDQVLMEREMQWLRIDRYYEGTPDEPQTFFQPMFCQMCEEAPCEIVCPPGATVHDAEGLNLMIYNRCIGTRFCSNNCPYKVRRFNFFAYSADQNRPVVSWNNNVSVRSGGVMEKCTYCVQRIWSARIIAAQTGVGDGTLDVRTACQAACPTQAFSFGDENNHETEVYKRKQSPLDYQLLESLNTHPRTTYEALVSNPNPALGKTGA
jgi:molybdopterin-containing oxidoreductase family iron-sulfur binding subunit